MLYLLVVLYSLSTQSALTDGIQITYSGREDMLDFIKDDEENGCHFDFTYTGKEQKDPTLADVYGDRPLAVSLQS